MHGIFTKESVRQLMEDELKHSLNTFEKQLSEKENSK
jgi:hypothetical protein